MDGHKYLVLDSTVKTKKKDLPEEQGEEETMVNRQLTTEVKWRID